MRALTYTENSVSSLSDTNVEAVFITAPSDARSLAVTVPKSVNIPNENSSLPTRLFSTICSMEWSVAAGSSDTLSVPPPTGPLVVDTPLLGKFAVCFGQSLLFEEACPRRLQALHRLAAAAAGLKSSLFAHFLRLLDL